MKLTPAQHQAVLAIGEGLRSQGRRASSIDEDSNVFAGCLKALIDGCRKIIADAGMELEDKLMEIEDAVSDAGKVLNEIVYREESEPFGLDPEDADSAHSYRACKVAIGE